MTSAKRRNVGWKEFKTFLDACRGVRGEGFTNVWIFSILLNRRSKVCSRVKATGKDPSDEEFEQVAGKIEIEEEAPIISLSEML